MSQGGGEVFRSGFAAIVGRANVGKSTLLNRLVGEKVAIVSDVPQTTRHRILGVRHLPGGQIVFIDRGQEDGVLEGNRLFVRRRRDMWRESWNQPDDRAGYPYEVIAELRVVEVRPRSSTCLITRSITDIHSGDTFEMRRGY